MAHLAQGFYTRFEQLDKPVIAMIDGLCLGGGLELAMACDIALLPMYLNLVSGSRYRHHTRGEAPKGLPGLLASGRPKNLSLQAP